MPGTWGRGDSPGVMTHTNTAIRRFVAPVARAQRAAATELHDSACELLLAAQRLDAAAAEPAAAPAMAAAAGCIDATIEALATALGALRANVIGQLESEATGDGALALAEGEQELGALIDALRVAHRHCDAMRERLGPLMAELTLR